MITPDYARQMARYNAWQNRSLYREAAALDDAERRADRGAFWGSVQGTLCHILWGDLMWMKRFAGWEGLPAQSDSASWLGWDEMVPRRAETDERLIAWADGLAPADLDGDLTWYSGSVKAELTRPRALLVVHMFNHQTHHRGQAHALLTALGRRPDDTDIPFGPSEALL